jgi:hypothetical protein
MHSAQLCVVHGAEAFQMRRPQHFEQTRTLHSFALCIGVVKRPIVCVLATTPCLGDRRRQRRLQLV